MRSLLKGLGGVLAAAVIALATLPYWMGAALPTVARLLHASVGSYEREGYSRFVLRNVAYVRGSVRVTVAKVEAATPLLWIWRHFRGKDEPVVGEEWAVRVDPTLAPTVPRAAGHTPSGLWHLHGQLGRVAAGLTRWLPRARVSGGSVKWPKGGFGLASADWNRGTLSFAGLEWAAGSAQGRATFAPSGLIRVDAQEPDREWAAAITWEGPSAQGHATVWGQPLELSARYGRQGWLPVQARAVAHNWSLSAQQARLGKYYGRLDGSGEAEWNEGAYSLSARAAAPPTAQGAPNLHLSVTVQGDHKQWSVKSLDVESPSGRVVLDHPISFGYGVRPSFSQATLDFSADLAAIPLLHAQGKVAGRMVLSADAGKLPVATVALTAKEAAWDTIPIGDYSIRGGCDFQNRSVSKLQVDASWRGSALRHWLPKGVSVAGMTAEATFDGPWSALGHAGSARVDGLSIPSAHADTASLSWRGSGFQFDAFEARMASGKTTLSAAGSANLSEARITDLRFAPEGKEALRLASPADVSWKPRFALTAVSLKGGASEIAGAYSEAGLFVRMNRIPSQWLRGIVDWQGPAFEIPSATLSAHRAGDRLAFSIQAGARLSMDNETVALDLQADSDGNRIRLQQFQAASAAGVLAEAGGDLPFAWDVSHNHWVADPDASLKLHARIDRGSPLWELLAGRLGISLSQGEASVDIDGSLNAPVGKLHLAVLRLSQTPGRTAWKTPPLDHLDVEAHADRESIVVDTLSASVLGQPLSGSGRLPTGGLNWQSLLERRGALAWDKAEAHLAVTDADVGAFASLLPAFVAPRGHVRLDLGVKDGAWEGAVHLAALALRPLAPLGQVQDITGDLVFSKRTLSIKGLSVEIGGAKVAGDGWVKLPAGGEPTYSLSLHGASVPLVRQADLLVRTDLDLRAETEAGTTRVSGRVDVRDAILLGNLADLLPSGMTAGARPPPYFSITAPAFRLWRLDVTLAAAHSLRAQTPLFSGSGSAQFQLTGTLGDPRATGRLQIDRGQILLPFATFDVRVGTIRLNADDPLHPQIDVQAIARRYDYDLRLTATGPADAPVLRFTSNPALPSDQILALVMAGQPPQNGGLIGAGNLQVENLGAYVGQNLFSGFSGRPSTNRLSVSSGQELSVTGRPTYEIEYRLSRNWWLTGEYDIFDDFNGGIKWRVYSKGGGP